MAIYRRFVTYLFLYEDLIKGKNCGFARIDARQGQCRMEIQMRGCEDGDYRVYMLVNCTGQLDDRDFSKPEEEQKKTQRSGWNPEGIEIGVFRMVDGFGSSVYMTDAENIAETSFRLEDIFGIYLTAGGNRFVASQWEDGEVDWSSFRVYDQRKRDHADEKSAVAGDDDGEMGKSIDVPKEKDGGGIREGQDEDAAKECPGIGAGEEDTNRLKNTRDGDEKSEETVNNETTVAEAKDPQSEVQAAGSTAFHPYGHTAGQPEVQATQTAAADISPYLTAWEKQWQQFCARHSVVCPFDEVQNIYAVKLDLRDLKNLPRQYRSLANNSFLLHGYFNYRYLLFGCEDGEKQRWFIAVPGVFQNQEQMLAGIFGFTEFRTKQVTKQKTGEFGYWYRYLEM